MLNHPFSTSFNIFEEKTHNTTPANILGQNVYVTQEQHHRVYDTLTTSIAGTPSYQPYPTVQTTCCPNPNSVTFTFGTSPAPQQQPWCCPCQAQQQQQPWQNSIAGLNQLQQRNMLDLSSLQQQLTGTPTGLLRFHLDGQTSTTDLTVNSNNYSGLSVVDELLKEENDKKVQFDTELSRKMNQYCNTDIEECKNAEIQAHVCCNCCCNTKNEQDETKQVRTKSKKKKKKKKKTASESALQYSDVTDDTEEDDDDIR